METDDQEKDHILRTFKPMVPIFPKTTSFLQIPCANTLNSIDFIWTGFLSTVTSYTVLIMHVLVALSCPTLCEPMDCSKPGSSVAGVSRQEYSSGLPFPSPGDLPNSGIEPRSPTHQADSLPSESPGKSLWLLINLISSEMSSLISYLIKSHLHYSISLQPVYSL